MSSSIISFIYWLNSFTSVWCSCTTFSTFLHIFFFKNTNSFFLSSTVSFTEKSFSVEFILLPGGNRMHSSHLKVFSLTYCMFSDIAMYPIGFLCLLQIIYLIFFMLSLLKTTLNNLFVFWFSDFCCFCWYLRILFANLRIQVPEAS